MVASDGIVLLRGGPRCVWILLRARGGIISRQTWSLRQTYVEQNDEQETKATVQRGSFSYLCGPAVFLRNFSECSSWYRSEIFRTVRSRNVRKTHLPG
jgi:hypothetical protein